MKLITYVCDRLGCDVEESIPPKDPRPDGWGELQILGRKDEKHRSVTFCPGCFTTFNATLAPEEAGTT